MGIVYRARQLSLNRPVALKMIKAARFASDGERRRFQNEAEAVAQLDHPNIVPIYEVSQYEDQQYFSMRLVAGESLDKGLKDYTADLKGAARLVSTAAAAIFHAHQRGILHRDLKPANILVDPDGQPHITDFGLAKRVDGDSDLTRSGAILGTPAYMAPEQASGMRGSVTTSTDIYGLGAILYALLTGRAPFGGATVLGTLEQVRERLPDPPRKLNPRVPRGLEVICLKCLEKDPRRRYASADALAEDLRRWLAGEPISARPVGRTVRFGMWCHRNPLIATAAGLVATALVVVTLLSVLYARQQARLAEAKTLYADEQTRRAQEQAAATTKIAGLNKNLQEESRNLNRRLAMLHFERAQHAFDSSEFNHGLLWLAESWARAALAGDSSWERLARANLTFWRYSSPEIKGVFSHSVALSNDAKVLLTQDERNKAELWEVETGRPISRLATKGIRVQSAAFSPDRKLLLTANIDNTARVWNVGSGQALGQAMPHNEILTIAFSPDGKTVLTDGKDNTTRLWNRITGEPTGVAIQHRSRATPVQLSPNGQTILTTGIAEARLWETSTGRMVGQPISHGGIQLWAAYSHDGKRVISGGPDQLARIWDAATGQPIGKPLQHQSRIMHVAFSPDATTALTATADKTVLLWDIRAGRTVGQPFQYSGDYPQVKFSPDGKTALLWSEFNSAGARLLDAASGHAVGPSLPVPNSPKAVMFRPDSRAVFAGSGKTARLWDAATGQPIGPPIVHELDIDSVAFNDERNSTLTRTQDGTVRLWDIRVEEAVGEPLEFQGHVLSEAFGPDGKSVLIVGLRMGIPEARLWDAVTRRPFGPPVQDLGSVRCGALSPDGKTILTVRRDGLVRLSEASTGQTIGKLMVNDGDIESIECDPDAQTILTRSFSGTVRLSKVASGATILKQENSKHAALSSDGRLLLIATANNTAELRETATAQLALPPLQHEGRVNSVAFSPDGKTIITGCDDRLARVWDSCSGLLVIRPVEHQSGVDTVAFSRDGRTFLTQANRTIKVFDTASGDAVGAPVVRQNGLLGGFSSDLKTLLVTDRAGNIRLFDSATGQPVGPSLKGGGPLLKSVAFSQDGNTVIGIYHHVQTESQLLAPAPVVRLWYLPTLLEADVRLIRIWIEAITGLTSNADGNIEPLDGSDLRDRRSRLARQGGAPKVDIGWLFDPVLHGPDPAVRARAWAERQCWDHAEVAFDEVMRAQPKVAKAWIERAEFYVARAQPEKAASSFVQAVMLGEQSQEVFSQIAANNLVFEFALPLLSSHGEGVRLQLLSNRLDHLARTGRVEEARSVIEVTEKLPWKFSAFPTTVRASFARKLALLGFPQGVSDLLNTYKRTRNKFLENEVVRCFALIPGTITDPNIAVLLAERRVEDTPDPFKSTPLLELGAVLCRTGRTAEAIQRFEESARNRNGSDAPLDWALLAMAHYRLGHRDEARRWLDRLRTRQPSTDPDQFWDELEFRLLRSEAEALILYDPIFPADPFAH
jgi:WD40 repeat protein/tetratricopeptide (TPR) repeat protein